MKHLANLVRLADNPQVLIGAGAAAVLVVGALLYHWRSRPPSPEEIERQRRLHVNRVGRIAEGRVTDLMKHEVLAPDQRGGLGVFRKRDGAGAASSSRQMICYSYSISGVTYETAQDITGLEGRMEGHRLVTGQSASVKYDPSNPSNSILVADDWSGLH